MSGHLLRPFYCRNLAIRADKGKLAPSPLWVDQGHECLPAGPNSGKKFAINSG